ncbi:hypothetical protein SDC9_169450 [bioreactor metagenome]|uniref:Uncharacterized protein n=1 Tax=bioreactor metagenome TaxID=1076179 RepID=A0A645G583_9ZZZZ
MAHNQLQYRVVAGTVYIGAAFGGIQLNSKHPCERNAEYDNHAQNSRKETPAEFFLCKQQIGQSHRGQNHVCLQHLNIESQA